QAADVDFVLFTGDAVALGFVQSDLDDWFAAVADVLPSLPLAFVLGNHVVTARRYFEQFAAPGNEQWFDFDYGSIHFVVLHDTAFEDSSIVPVTERDFLASSLQGTSHTAKMVS